MLLVLTYTLRLIFEKYFKIITYISLKKKDIF